jgi:predicted transcriptional regulator
VEEIMQINLPQDLFERLQVRVASTKAGSEADIIRQALDSLDWQEGELQAIREGIDDWRAGRIQDFDEFDAEFRAQNGIQADR